MSIHNYSVEASEGVLTCPDSEAQSIREYLWNNDEMLKGDPRQYLNHPLAGACYVASEAYYHLLDNKNEWTPQQMVVEWTSGNVKHDTSHWFLKHSNGTIVDLTAEQFHMTPAVMNYDGGIGRGFVPPSPSKRAQTVLKELGYE